jgi:hypothetical protein
MSRAKWDLYIRDRIVALIDETDANVLVFDGVIPHAGFIAARNARPNVKLVWMRRGLWQKKVHRFALPLQSAAMDYVIEPGDYAFAYDHGPTSKRTEAIRTAPVSLYQASEALNREVLVQLGTGADDANEKMTAALKGLIGWPDLQVVLTKEPIDKLGKSLAPEGLDLKVIKYFPLAKVLAAFDAGVCATGYNGVHELLAAKLPTVLVSNIRGMDDQEARAKWCHDFGYALRANQADLNNITETVKELQDANMRASLAYKCAELPSPIGGEEIANKLIKFAAEPTKAVTISQLLRYQVLRYIAIAYHQIAKEKSYAPLTSDLIVFSDSVDAKELSENIRSGTRFEQLFKGASENYHQVRREIARKYYGK